MPGGDPLATCTLPVGVVYLLTYLHKTAGVKPRPGAGGRAGGRATVESHGDSEIRLVRVFDFVDESQI